MFSESESLPSDLKNLSDLLGDCKEEVVLLDGQILELSPDYSNQDPTNGVLANYSNQSKSLYEVAQLVRCRTSNQRVAGSVRSRGTSALTHSHACRAQKSSDYFGHISLIMIIFRKY